MNYKQILEEHVGANCTCHTKNLLDFSSEGMVQGMEIWKVIEVGSDCVKIESAVKTMILPLASLTVIFETSKRLNDEQL